jgi:hypothetical protein
MPIITAAEVKSIGLQTTVTTWDTLIATLIPIAQAKILKYCGVRYFLNRAVQISGTGIALVSGSPATITDSDSGFVTAELVAGDYKIYGTSLNEKIVTIQTVAAALLTLATGETLVSEIAGDEITIIKVDWVDAMKYDVIMFIVWMMHEDGKLVNSESLPGGWSGQYRTEKEMLSAFNGYRT